MIAHKSSKTFGAPGLLVGVVATRAALKKATRLRSPLHFFELRLDALRDSLDEVARAIPKLRAPLILTARHPAEGGHHALALTTRRKLLLCFLDHAAFIDIELRTAPRLKPLLAEARRRKIALILSSHHLRDTPPPGALCAQLEAAITLGADIFKIATRTDTAPQLARLLAFFREHSSSLPIAAMGMGRRGPESRRRLMRLGSVLNYASLDHANAPGQPSLRRLRRHWRAYSI